MKRSAPTYLLLIEDDPVDIYVIQRIVADFRQDLHLWITPDGGEALRFLRQAPLAHAPRPALILLDLKLPHLDGALLLPQIRQLPAYQATPIIIFSSTPKEREGERCFQLGATAYVQKSTDFAGFCDKVKGLLQQWLP
jgi:two-component system, chemotaxis family, response regulator Rcp1